MAQRVIDLDQELGFEELKPSIKFYGKKWYLNIGPDVVLKAKIIEKQINEKMKNLQKSKKKQEEQVEVYIEMYRSIFRVYFGDEQAKEIFELGLSQEQIDLIVKAINVIMEEKDFDPNEPEEKEKKTSLEKSDTTLQTQTTTDC